MGAPSRIGIATHGYRRGDSNPGKVCIATHGYRCLEPETGIDPFGGGMGHGAIIQDRERRAPQTEDEQLAILAVLAIEEMYDA